MIYKHALERKRKLQLLPSVLMKRQKLYRRRHRIENFFQRIKRYRRVATRYDKLGETFLGFVCLGILLTLRLT